MYSEQLPPLPEEDRKIYAPRKMNSLSKAFEVAPPPLQFLIPGFLQGDVGGLIAPGATGKSFAALELSFAVCGAKDLLDINPQVTGMVTYFCAEDQEAVVAHRMHSMAPYFSQEDRRKIQQNFTAYDLRGEDNDLMNPSCIDYYIQAGIGSKLLIFDTLSRMHNLEENDNGAMSLIIRQLEKITKATGASVLFLHHTGKASAREAITDAQAARGGGALIDNSRFCANLAKMSEKEAAEHKVDIETRDFYLKYLVTKQNFSAPAPPKWLQRSNGVLVTWQPSQAINRTVPPQVTPVLNQNNETVRNKKLLSSHEGRKSATMYNGGNW